MLVQQSQIKKRAQIYLLIGYFGSGKTTLIRNLLKEQHQKKYAIIQNQFSEGEMGIQQPLIVDESGTPFSRFLQLPNGCICCSAKNDLVAAIEYILNNTDVSKIVVQTNGLANPAEMCINAELRGVITLLSASRWHILLKDQLVAKQILFADTILITFVDCVSVEQVEAISLYVRQINTQCRVEIKGKVQVRDIFEGNGLFCLTGLEKKAKENSITQEQHGQQHSQQHVQQYGQQNGQQHGQTRSVFVQGKCLLAQPKEFEIAVGKLLWESSITILRIKGVVCFPGYSTVFELQGIQDTFQLKPTTTKKQRYSGNSKILLIGMNLQKQKLYNNLHICSQTST